LFAILQITRRANTKEGDKSQDNMSPYRKLYQQFGAVCGNRHCSPKKKSVMVTTQRTNPGQNNTHEEARRTNPNQNDTHEEAESINPEVRIANLNQQLAQAQKNVEDLLAQNALLQAVRTPAPSQHLEIGKNSQTEDGQATLIEHPEDLGE
jgi:hypothetical protein